MTIPTESYVDPSIAGDSGAGTVGDPWGDIQYGLDQVTRDATNGDRFNIKAGTDELQTAALSLATYGTPAFDKPLIFQGYTSAAGDGGIGAINMQGNNASIVALADAIHFMQMHLHNTGSAAVVNIGQFATIQLCEINNSSGNGIVLGAHDTTAIGNHVHDIGGEGISGVSRHAVMFNYCKNGTKDFTYAIRARGLANTVMYNIVSVDGTSHGIGMDGVGGYAWVVSHNSIFSAGGTGKGILVEANDKLANVLANNLVEGFSGSGGEGIEVLAGGYMGGTYQGNAVFNCATKYDVDETRWINQGDNEELIATPFDKSGADTFANRFVYFAPVDTGNVHGGAYVAA